MPVLVKQESEVATSTDTLQAQSLATFPHTLRLLTKSQESHLTKITLSHMALALKARTMVMTHMDMVITDMATAMPRPSTRKSRRSSKRWTLPLNLSLSRTRQESQSLRLHLL